MSEVTNVLQTGSQLTTNYDKSKIFLGGNRYAKATYKNTTGAAVTLPAGTLMAKRTAIAVDTTNAIGNLVPFASADTEGGAIPVGILAQDLNAVANGASVLNVVYCIGGDYDLDALDLQGADTLATIVNGKAIREHILAETQLIGVVVDQLSALDNQ